MEGQELGAVKAAGEHSPQAAEGVLPVLFRPSICQGVTSCLFWYAPHARHRADAKFLESPGPNRLGPGIALSFFSRGGLQIVYHTLPSVAIATSFFVSYSAIFQDCNTDYKR